MRPSSAPLVEVIASSHCPAGDNAVQSICKSLPRYTLSIARVESALRSASAFDLTSSRSVLMRFSVLIKRNCISRKSSAFFTLSGSSWAIGNAAGSCKWVLSDQRYHWLLSRYSTAAPSALKRGSISVSLVRVICSKLPFFRLRKNTSPLRTNSAC